MKTARPLAQLDRTALGVWLGLAVFTAVFFYIHAIHANFVQDDAYITYRYARNLSQGLGFVYNINEHVLGTTTPLFTLVLAAGARVTQFDIPTVSLVIGLVSLWISAGTLYQLGQAYSKSWGLTLALVYLTNPFLSQFIGMESFGLVGLLLVAVWAYQRGRLGLAALLCGLLILMRYEMGLLAGLLAGLDLWSRRRLPLWLWPSLALPLPWLLYAWTQFGSPVPLSAVTKLAAARVPFPLGAVLYAYSFITTWPPVFVVVVLFMLGVLSAAVLRRLPGDDRLVVYFGLLYFGVASAVAGSFPWYYAPLAPAFAVMVAAGMQLVAELLAALPRGWAAPQREQLTRRLRWPILAAVVAIQLVFWVKNYARTTDQFFDNRFAPYQQAAHWLNQFARPRQTLAAYEIGYLGYFADVNIVDLSGLVTPGLSAWVKDGGDVMLTHALQLYAPDFVLISSADQARVAILDQDTRYHLAQTFEATYRLYRRSP